MSITMKSDEGDEGEEADFDMDDDDDAEPDPRLPRGLGRMAARWHGLLHLRAGACACAEGDPAEIGH